MLIRLCLGLLLALALLTPACGGEGGDGGVTCSSSCSDRDFDIAGESGPSLFQVQCQTTFDYPGGKQRVTSEHCKGTRTYSESGHAYAFTADWDQVSCRLTVDVEGIGSCTAP
jgi:hypothetical protein